MFLLKFQYGTQLNKGKQNIQGHSWLNPRFSGLRIKVSVYKTVVFALVLTLYFRTRKEYKIKADFYLIEVPFLDTFYCTARDIGAVHPNETNRIPVLFHYHEAIKLRSGRN
jgi:hypothetical protein